MCQGSSSTKTRGSHRCSHAEVLPCPRTSAAPATCVEDSEQRRGQETRAGDCHRLRGHSPYRPCSRVSSIPRQCFQGTAHRRTTREAAQAESPARRRAQLKTDPCRSHAVGVATAHWSSNATGEVSEKHLLLQRGTIKTRAGLLEGFSLS